jgi:hypothetical protein
MTATRAPSDLVEALYMRAAWLAVALVLLCAVPAVADETDPGAITPPRLSYTDGPVSFWRPGAEQWAPAQVNTPLAPGDQLLTGHGGTAEIQVGGRAFLRAWGDTALGVVDHASDVLHVKITDGHVVADLRAVDAGGILHVETPGGAFTLDRPGFYRLDVTPQATSLTTRREGQPPRTTRVEAGATRTVAAPALDAWDRWNQLRTDEVLYTTSARYVGEGTYGLRDLDEHGNWRVLPTYGAVWVPRGAPAGWAPYTTGRWVWDPRFGWTWVDAAVWGWAPFHHGRWVYLDGVWAWAPGPIVVRPAYAPALVAFFHAPGVRVSVGTPFVSWVALGWGEPVVPWWGRAGFVGRPHWLGWSGPRVVNNVVVNRTTIVNVTDIRVYRNARVSRALVAVAPERFGRARVEDARVTTVDTRRLEPVRGALRVAPEPVSRTEPPSRPPRAFDAERGRPAEAARPAEPSRRPEMPARMERPRIERPDTRERGVPERRERPDRRGPAASVPILKGAASHERAPRGESPQRGEHRGRGEGRAGRD